MTLTDTDTAVAAISSVARVEFDAAAWIEMAEKTLLFPQVMMTANGPWLNIIWPPHRFLDVLNAAGAEKAVYAVINEPDGGFKSRSAAVLAILRARGEAFDAAAWLKKQQRRGFRFHLTGESSGHVLVGYEAPRIFADPSTGEKFPEERHIVLRLFGETRLEFYRYQAELCDAIWRQSYGQEAALPFVRKNRDPRVPSMWAPKVTGIVGKDYDAGKRFAFQAMQCLRVRPSSDIIERVLSGIARQSPRQRKRTRSVADGFLAVIAQQVVASARDKRTMADLAEKYGPKPRAKRRTPASAPLKKAA